MTNALVIILSTYLFGCYAKLPVATLASHRTWAASRTLNVQEDLVDRVFRNAQMHRTSVDSTTRLKAHTGGTNCCLSHGRLKCSRSQVAARWLGDRNTLTPAKRTAEGRPTHGEDLADVNQRSLLASTSILDLSQKILLELKRRKPSTVPGMDQSLHYLPPLIQKTTWNALGELISTREESTLDVIAPDQWISLRLDGHGFRKALQALKRHGILESEIYCERFADSMEVSLKAVMEQFHASVGYTHSDEMIAFIPPAMNGASQEQNGRVTKLSTLASAVATAAFVLELGQLCVGNNISLSGLVSTLPHFDCRLGHYGSWEEAQSVLMWRASDCAMNGLSDAVYLANGGKNSKSSKLNADMSLNTVEKAKWLWKKGLLPLPRRHAYGVLLVKVKRRHTGYNPKTKQNVTTVRNRIISVDGPVIELMRTDALIPKDETV